ISVYTKPGEDSLLWIPKSMTDGRNWIMYRVFLQISIDSQRLHNHLDGTEIMPIDLKMFRRMGNAITKQKIAGIISDTLCIQVKGLITAHEMFEHLVKLFKKQSCIFFQLKSFERCRTYDVLRRETCKSTDKNYKRAGIAWTTRG
ncbi:hypothetical protein PAXRUDRAFT_157410, partial [Paxillus rubicundulus Ve08.2h10]